jgi:ubiquitin conjugation factor E4 B
MQSFTQIANHPHPTPPPHAPTHPTPPHPTRRQNTQEQLSEAERAVKGCSALSLETLHMMNYLSSDEFIRKPFLMDAILQRFADMLLSVLYNLVGKKGLEIKVEGMEGYGFNPKRLLQEACQAMAHFAEFEEFHLAIAVSGLFEAESLRKAIETCSKLGLISGEDKGLLGHLHVRAVEMKEGAWG